jgi:ParB family chromosome partitioning protein
LVVRKAEAGQYELIAGERRLHAAKLAGFDKVPVVVLDISSHQSLELALIENIQRQDLNPIEEALAYKQLMEKYYYTQEEVAKRVGKERSTVANALRLLNLPEEVRREIVDGRLSMGHARALLGVSDVNLQTQFSKKIVEEGLSVREVEDLVKNWKGGIKIERFERTRVISPQLVWIENEMTRKLETKIKIQPSSEKKGRVVIHYSSGEDLDRIFNLIAK